MKLATLRNGTRDGQLVVVNRGLTRALPVPHLAATLQEALDNWARCVPLLRDAAESLEKGAVASAPFRLERAMAPLPRAYQWVDGSAYVNHVELVRKARGAEMPASFWTDPLVYQGGSDDFLGAGEDVTVPSEEFGIDLEGEVAVITDDVPMGTSRDQARQHIKLLMLVNDWSLRNLIPARARQGFRLLPVEARDRVLAGRGDAGRARRRVGRRQDQPAAQRRDQRRAVRQAGSRRRHDVRFPAADRARHEDAQRARRHDRRLGHDLQLRSQPRLGLPGRAPHAGSCWSTARPITPFLKFGDRVRIEMLDASAAEHFRRDRSASDEGVGGVGLKPDLQPDPVGRALARQLLQQRSSAQPAHLPENPLLP